jgi:carbamate kinase
MPLHVEVGMTQGEIGHLIAFGLRKWMPTQQITTILTHVEVDPHDNAFKHPTKPIGPWYKTAQHLKKEKIPFIHDAKKGFRKIVASPTPKKIIEMDAIENLLEKNHLVIACGGGGIPVTRQGKKWQCADAVIDKDFATQVLGNSLNAKEMIILTNESYAYTQYASKPKPIHTLSVAKAQHYFKKGEFGKGSMEPKIRSSIRFIQKGGKAAYIGKTGELEEVLAHEKGTRIHK